MHPIVVIEPKIDYPTVLACFSALNPEVTNNLDKHNIKPDQPSSFIVMLNNLKIINSSPKNSLRDSGNVLGHLTYGFFVKLSFNVAFKIATETDLLISTVPLQIDPDNEVGMITGNMNQWKQAIIECCPDLLMRELFNWFYGFFLQKGFEPIFENYKRVQLSNGFVLCK